MDRAARSARPKAPSPRLLVAHALLAFACATVEQPPGGPPDPAPPVLLGVTPDSGSVMADFEDDVDFQFDEVINEGAIGSLNGLFRLSPRHDDVTVSWRRSRITVKPGDGWRRGEVYSVTLLPGVTDLRNNRLEEGRTIVFSTGDSIPDTYVTGTVVDWERGRIADGALVEATRASDSVTYFTTADSAGVFSLRHVPPGTYTLFATADQNRNNRRDGREAFDSVTVTLDSVMAHEFWAFVRDTIGPRLTNVTIIDSLSIALDFNQSLALQLPPASAARVLALPDSIPISVASLMWRPDFDSLQAAVRDSIAQAQRDSVAAAAAVDSAVVDSIVPDSQPVPPVPDAAPLDSAALDQQADSAAVQALISQRPPLTNQLVIRLGAPLIAGERYYIETTVANLLNVTEISFRAVVAPEERAVEGTSHAARSIIGDPLRSITSYE